MRIIFVDDEPSAHLNFCQDIETQDGITSLQCFFTAEEALTYAENNTVDCAFLDIDLRSKISGLDLARYLKAIQPDIEVAFLTAFDEYTKISYQLGGCAYLNKPCMPYELHNALQLMQRLIQSQAPKSISVSPDKPRVQLRTFGNFDLIMDGCAVAFKMAKAKEALAFLVDQMGGSVSGAQIFFALWEEQEYTPTTSVYVRRTIRALRAELEALDILDILVCGRNAYSVDTARLDCDSYALLNGGQHEAICYNGEYMRQYYWGESTIPLLDRAAQRVLENSMNLEG